MKASSPDRVIFPDDGLTKQDVVDYYDTVSTAMLPHVAGRPLTLQRFPKGIGEPGFMQKNAAAHFPDSIERVEVPKQDEGVTTYPVVHDAADIPWLANQGTITFHVWASRLPDLDRPDRTVFDLDPPEGGDPGQVAEAALLVRADLEEIGLPTVPMATGSKGYHLVTAITPAVESWDLGPFCQGLAAWLARRHPAELTDEFRKANRKGRVFVDWLRNQPHQTAVAAWSLRARPGAPVAVPFTWERLAETPPDRWHLSTIDEALALGDPLADAAPIDPVPVLAAIHTLLADEGIEPSTFDRFRS